MSSTPSVMLGRVPLFQQNLEKRIQRKRRQGVIKCKETKMRGQEVYDEVPSHQECTLRDPRALSYVV